MALPLEISCMKITSFSHIKCAETCHFQKGSALLPLFDFEQTVIKPPLGSNPHTQPLLSHMESLHAESLVKCVFKFGTH